MNQKLQINQTVIVILHFFDKHISVFNISDKQRSMLVKKNGIKLLKKRWILHKLLCL